MKKTALLFFALFLAGNLLAQDDDVYFVPSSKSEQQTQTRQRERQIDLPAENTVTYYYDDDTAVSTNNWAEGRGNGGRDVDEYNRRGGDYDRVDTVYAESEAETADAGASGEYTERIVRFHSPRAVVVSSPYYVDYYDLCYDPFFYDPWRYSWYSPWYVGAGWSSWYGGWGFGIGWSWHAGWGWHGWYDPWYAYHWGWGYPHYGWGHGWHGWHNNWAYVPSNARFSGYNGGWRSEGTGRRKARYAAGNSFGTRNAGNRYSGLRNNRYTGTGTTGGRVNNRYGTSPSRGNAVNRGNATTRPSRPATATPSRNNRRSTTTERSVNSNRSNFNSNRSNFNSNRSSFGAPSRSGGFSPSRSGGSRGGRR